MVQRNDRYLTNIILRDLTRTFFKVILVILSVAGCTQSITWIGEASNPKYRKAPAVYDRYNGVPSSQPTIEKAQDGFYEEGF